MAGILDSKQRIMDVIITKNGRRQIADNTFVIRYASFSDHGIFYQNDGTDIADAAEDRISFEAYASSTDIIIPEINDINAITIDTSSGNLLANSKFYTSGSTSSGTSTIKTGSLSIYSSSAEVISTAIDNFDRLQIIGSNNNGFEEENILQVTKEKLKFSYPLEEEKVDVNDLPPLYVDESLVSQENFKYMPPVYLQDNLELPLAAYPKFQTEPYTSINSALDDLYSDNQTETFEINSTNPTDLLCQVFEISENEIKKLAIVDYGSYYDDSGRFLGQLYHLGKLYRDSSNVLKFVKIMCILFE